MPFPYLLLPKLVQYEVLQNSNTVDTIFFSTISSKTKEIARRSNKKIHSIAWILCGSGYCISVQSPSRYYGTFRVPVFPDKRCLRPVKFNKEVVPSYSGPHYLSLGSEDISEVDQKKLFDQLNDLIFDVFKFKECHFIGNIFQHREFVSKYTKKLRSMRINENDIQPELPDVLEEFGVEELDVKTPRASQTTPTPVMSPIESSKPLKVKNLRCANLKWLTMETFWSLDCEEVTLKAGCLQIDQLNELIKRWIAGGWQNLKEFKISLSVTDADLVRIFEDIETDQNDDDSYRVQREDGKSARIAVEEIGFVMRTD